METPTERLDMKSEWDQRARENARYFIAPGSAESDEEFFASGERDARLFFDGLEHLLGSDVTLLEIGCGIGRMSRVVAPRIGRLVALDVSPEMLQRASDRLREFPNTQYVEGDGWTLKPIANNSIDTVFSHIVFQHAPRLVMANYLHEAFRVLRPGGHFAFQVPGANVHTPADPPASDTWEMRFYYEFEVHEALAAIGFEAISTRRFPIQSTISFDQLRMCAKKP